MKSVESCRTLCRGVLDNTSSKSQLSIWSMPRRGCVGLPSDTVEQCIASDWVIELGL